MRTNRLVIALSEEERGAIDDMAEAEKLAVSTMARRILLFVALGFKEGKRWKFESVTDNIALAIDALDGPA